MTTPPPWSDPDDLESAWADGSDGDPTGSDAAGDEAGAQPRYPSMYAWFEAWLAPTLARKLSGATGKGRVWCPEWWRHAEVIARVNALWMAWEGACMPDARPGALSAWFTYDLDPHLRVLMDADGGPMFDCRRDEHRSTPPLRAIVVPAPVGWFDDL